MANRLDISESTAVSMPDRNMLAIIGAVVLVYGHTLVC